MMPDTHLTDAELICRAWGIDRPIPAAGLFLDTRKDAGDQFPNRNRVAAPVCHASHDATVSQREQHDHG